MGADTIDVAWSGVTLSNEGPYIVEMLTGWEGLPSPRVTDVARPNAHGSFKARIRAASRTVVAEGHCNTQESRDQLLHDLGRSLVFTEDEDDLTITFAGRTLTAHAQVSRYGPTLRDWGVGCFGWQVEWWAPDPFRYGPVSTATAGLPEDTGGMEFPLFDGGTMDFGTLGSPGQVTLHNTGSAPAWPTFTVEGPVPTGFEIRETTTGARIRWGGSIPSGTVVVLDSGTGAATYDGARGYEGHLVRRQWAPVPAGGSATWAFIGLGAHDPDASLTASIRATYW
jgi:hypothetical protein